MILKRDLLRQLKKLDILYNEALLSGDSDLPKYYSRLAVLELGGWIEACMDELAHCYPRRKRLRSISNKQYVNDVIDRNYGFSYKDNFRKIIKKVCGVVILEKVENRMNATRKQALESALSLLYPERNEHAHQTISRSPQFTAPSVCISLFKDIFDGLEDFEKHIKKM